MNSLALLLLLCVVIGSHAFLFVRPKALSTRRYLFGSPEPPKNQPPAKKGGLFGDMGNMMDNLKKAQEMAKVYQESMKELAETPITGTDPTGQVTATFTGALIPVSIKFSDSIVGSNAEALSTAATQAMLDAYAKAQKEMVTKLKLPGVPGQP
eukprot:gene13274-14580_t